MGEGGGLVGFWDISSAIKYMSKYWRNEKSKNGENLKWNLSEYEDFIWKMTSWGWKMNSNPHVEMKCEPSVICQPCYLKLTHKVIMQLVHDTSSVCESVPQR